MAFLEKLFELIMGLMNNCPGSRDDAQRSDLKTVIRKPGRVAKWILRRRARQEGLVGTEEEWKQAYELGANMSEMELDLLISESWSAFATDGS